jgi:hypothetical protein
MDMKRASILAAAVFAVMATSKYKPSDPIEIKPCPIGDGDDVPCAHHACAERLDRDDEPYGFCDVNAQAPFGMPDVISPSDMETMEGIYIYVRHFDTFGTQDLPFATAVADPFWVDVFTASYLSKDLAQTRQFVGWSVPQVDTDPPTFAERLSGFVYLPIDAGLRQLLIAHKDVFAINPKSLVDVRFTYAIEKQQHQMAVPLTLPSVTTPLPDSPDEVPEGYVVDDVRFINSSAVEEGTRTDRLPITTPRNFVALHFTEPLADDVDPAALIKVTRKDGGEAIVTGWTIGPDRRALFGAMVHDDAEFDIAIPQGMKSRDDKKFSGVSEDSILVGQGFTISVAP